MEFESVLFGIGYVVIIVAILGVSISGIMDHRAEAKHKRKEQEQIRAEEARLAALPKLDTSHMLRVPQTPEELEYSTPFGGSFGNRYVHMLVTDRDGAEYLCFMTEHNMRALWCSEFHQSGYTPILAEHDKNFVVNGVEIRVHPTILRRYSRDSEIWKRWAELHEEFKHFGQAGNNHFHSFEKYFDGGKPRARPYEVAV